MFGFPKAEYNIYKRNFLRKVFFQIDFKKSSRILENEEFVKSIFFQKFPRFIKAQGKGLQITIGDVPKLETLSDDEALIFKSQDGQITVEMNDKSIKLSFDNTAYQSKVDIKNALSLITHLFNDKIEAVDRIILRKINIIEFDSTNNPNGILYYLLNKSIVGNVDSFPNTELINHNLQSVNYRNDNFYLNLKYGMNMPPNTNLKIGQVIIDVECVKHTSTTIAEIENVFDDINSEMFNVFDMLINDNAKNILNGN